MTCNVLMGTLNRTHSLKSTSTIHFSSDFERIILIPSQKCLTNRCKLGQLRRVSGTSSDCYKITQNAKRQEGDTWRVEVDNFPDQVRLQSIVVTNNKLSWCWQTCATRYHPEGGKVSATGWLPTAVSYAEGVLTYRQAPRTALPLLSVIRPKISKSTQVTDSLFR